MKVLLNLKPVCWMTPWQANRSLKPRTHDKQMLSNICWQTFVSHDKQMLDNNSMAEMADSADDDDVAAAVISVIAFCYDSRELMYRINMDISHT